MAIALEKLEDKLKCSICLETYTNPKQLQCNHVYCQQCLVKLVCRDQRRQPSLTCPSCRKVTNVPDGDAANLQTAFQITTFLEIVEEHRQEKVAKTGSKKIPDKVYCTEHNGAKVKLYCETCEKPICWKCIKIGEKHHSHKYEELDEAFKQYQDEIKSILEPLEDQLAEVKTALTQLDTRHDEILHQLTRIEADIHNTIQRLHETLDARKTELISQLHQLSQTKLKNLAAQRDQLETTQAQLNSCLLPMKENLETNNHAKVMLMKSTTVRQAKKLITTFQPDMLELCPEANMIFSTLTDLNAELQTYGKVHQMGPDPSKCSATEIGRANVGEKCTAILELLNFDSQPCRVFTDSISCILVSEITSSRTRGSIKRLRHNQYEISYTPTIKGRHQLSIIVRGQHILESPFLVKVRSSSVEKLGTPILTIDNMKCSYGVAINEKGEMLVADYDTDSIRIFNTSGESIEQIGSRGYGVGEFREPTGVTVSGANDIFVVDNANHRIQKYKEDRSITHVGTYGRGNLQFDFPYDAAFNASNNKVYVTDGRNYRIQILNADLSYYNDFPTEVGNGRPSYIACDNSGNVYVSGCDHCVQVFTAEGEFLRRIGASGMGEGELSFPQGIGLDFCNRLYVAESGNYRVSVFTSEGEFVTSFGSSGDEPGQFRNPRGLTVDSCGIVYVCDSKKVQLF